MHLDATTFVGQSEYGSPSPSSEHGMRFGLLGTIALIVSAGIAAAQPAAPATGQEGQFLPGPFRVFAVTGSRALFMHDFFVENDLNPGVAVIALQTPTNDPLAGLL